MAHWIASIDSWQCYLFGGVQMKYFKRLEVYKASNVTFNPKSLEAYSYGYWRFVECINGKIVFNNFYYSPTTNRHQSKVRRLMNDLGINIDLEISVPCGLQRTKTEIFKSLHHHYTSKITKLMVAINKPRSQKAKNIERQACIDSLLKQVDAFDIVLTSKGDK